MITDTKVRPASRKEFVVQCKRDNAAFLDANRKRIYVEYVRDPVFVILDVNQVISEDRFLQVDDNAKGNPTAVIVAYKNDDGTLSIGWSAARSAAYDNLGVEVRTAERFDKPIGLWKAIRRATGQGRPFNKDRHPHRINLKAFERRAIAEFDRKV